MNTRSRTICPLSSEIPITAERESAEKFCPHWSGAAERWGIYKQTETSPEAPFDQSRFLNPERSKMKGNA